MGLIAGLFALAILPAPAQYTRAVVERAAFAIAYGMPDGTLPEICGDHGKTSDGHEQHRLSPACDACVLMAAPGLQAQPFVTAVRRVTAVESARRPPDAPGRRQVARTPRQARAPPLTPIA